MMQKKGMNIKVLLKPGVDLFERVTNTNTNGKLRAHPELSKIPSYESDVPRARFRSSAKQLH